MQSTASELQDRAPMPVPKVHFVLGTGLQPPFPAGLETAVFGRGCFWGVEKRFWEIEGVHTTAAGYAGGALQHPTYRDVCGGDTGHAEVVLVVYDPTIVSYDELLESFWDGHNPTQGFRQGYDIGSQYRSLIIASTEEQLQKAQASRARQEQRLSLGDDDRITTEVELGVPFYYAEGRHQQYLAKRDGV